MSVSPLWTFIGDAYCTAHSLEMEIQPTSFYAGTLKHGADEFFFFALHVADDDGRVKLTDLEGQNCGS